MKRARIMMGGFLMLGAACAAPARGADYSDGIFVVNEDWYGHQNSTLNFLRPDDPDGNYWSYRVFQQENPGMELGCTNQFGAIWNGKFYLIAKQAKDPGADIEGGRLTIADAATMKEIHQESLIDPSGNPCDGRAFIGVDKHKGYISTSNGVWILNLDTFNISGPIAGTDNPDPKNLYKAQCGTMVSAAGKIFVAHQAKGVIVIDPEDDRVIETISMDCVEENAGIGSIVRDCSGFLWLSVAKNTSGNGATLPYLVRLDPESLTTEIILIPEPFSPPSNSWYAWTPDPFIASADAPALYWGGGQTAFFSNRKIFRFDTNTHETSIVVDLESQPGNWKLYGCSLGIDPGSDNLYMSLYHDFSDQTYITRRTTADGVVIKDYPMIANYWFPSLFVFPPSGDSGFPEIPDEMPDSSSTLNVQWFTTDGKPVTHPSAPGIYIRHTPFKTEKVFIRN